MTRASAGGRSGRLWSTVDGGSGRCRTGGAGQQGLLYRPRPHGGRPTSITGLIRGDRPPVGRCPRTTRRSYVDRVFRPGGSDDTLAGRQRVEEEPMAAVAAIALGAQTAEYCDATRLERPAARPRGPA